MLKFKPFFAEIPEEYSTQIDTYSKNKGIKKKQIAKEAIGDWVKKNIGSGKK